MSESYSSRELDREAAEERGEDEIEGLRSLDVFADGIDVETAHDDGSVVKVELQIELLAYHEVSISMQGDYGREQGGVCDMRMWIEKGVDALTELHTQIGHALALHKIASAKPDQKVAKRLRAYRKKHGL